MIHGSEYTDEFLKAARNIEKLTHYTPREITLKNVLLHRNLVITVQGVQKLQNNLKKSQELLFKIRNSIE